METTFEIALIRLVKAAGGLALKFVSPGVAGVPDRLVLRPGGRLLFVELKDKGGKLRPLQEYRKEQIEALGFAVQVIDSKEKLEALRDEIHPPRIPAVRHSQDPRAGRRRSVHGHGPRQDRLRPHRRP